MSKSIQLELPWDVHLSPGNGNRDRNDTTVWYYLYNSLRDEMLTIDANGRWCWVSHDTIRGTPHLFNTRWLAQNMQRNYPKSQIKRYRYKV